MKKLTLLPIIIFATLIGFWGMKLYNEHRFHLEKESRFMMDTYVTIYALGPEKITSRAINLALDRMEEIGVRFNSLNPKSPVYAFNYNNTPISDPEILKLIQLGLEISQKTDGAFDMTVEPLLELWGFYDKSFHIPKEQRIRDCLKDVGYKHLFINKGRLEKDNKGVRIDLGGIAKGYAISQAISVLKKYGITSALIDDGGDVYGLGKKGSSLWKIGIKDPRGDGVVGYVEAKDMAVMTSGDYERFFIKNGRRYHHIFNSKTGYPTTEGVASVTLMYHDPILAQIWAKIPFVMGAKKGFEVLSKISGMKVIIITTSGEILSSPGLKHILDAISKTAQYRVAIKGN